MTSIGRVVVWSVAVGLICCGLLSPLVFSKAAVGRAAITDAHVDFRSDGEGHATEAIAGDFGPAMYGIVHSWKTAPTDVSALLDGRPVAVAMRAENGGDPAVANIGDPDSYLDRGRHTFEIRYTVRGDLIRPPPRLRFPGCPEDLRGKVCQETTTVPSIQTDHPARGTVKPWFDAAWYKCTAIVGQSVAVMLAVAALTVAAAIGGHLWGRSTREQPPEPVPQPEPPAGLAPVQFAFIRDKFVGDGQAAVRPLMSTFFYLADRGLITLKEVGSENWTIRGVKGQSQWARLDPVSRTFGAKLKIDTPGAEFTIDRRRAAAAGRRLNTAAKGMGRAARRWSLAEGLVRKIYSAQLLVPLSLCAVLASIWVFLWGRAKVGADLPPTMWGVPFAVFFLATVRWWRLGIGLRCTSEGRQLWSRIEGFHRVLTTDSANARVNFAARNDPYTSYIPFAAAVGAITLWAQKYEAATGSRAPQPDWYQRLATSLGRGGSFDSFSSALADSLEAAEPAGPD